MKELEDLDTMPFGQYKGQPMQDVPAPYLHFLWIKGLQHNLKNATPQGLVARYIKRNIKHLQQEHPDGIWT